MDKNSKTRLLYICAIALLIVIGLVSRKVSFIPQCFGDALWAVVMYCCWRILLVKQKPLIAAVGALVTSYAVEFSQLIKWDWLVRVRSTTIGHLLLGQGFLWSDLAAYTVGVAAALMCTLAVRTIILRENNNEQNSD